MTVLAVCQRLAPRVGMSVPSVVYGSTDRKFVELGELANETAEAIAKAHEWEALAAQATITGDGTTEDFDLPSDYDRMPQKAHLWSSSLDTPLTPIPDRDTWLGLDIRDISNVINSWIIYGGQIHIKQALATGITAKYFYQSNLIVSPASGSNKAAFTLDTDSFRLDERLLRLGMLWQWKHDKGLAYSEDMETFEALKEKLIAADKGSYTIRVGRARWPRDIQMAYPRSISS